MPSRKRTRRRSKETADTAATPKQNPPAGRPRVFVALPTEGRLHEQTLQSVQTMIRNTTRAEVVHFKWADYRPSDRCRNMLVREFLQDKQWTHILFVDTDMIVPPQTLDELLESNQPLICAPAPLRNRHKTGSATMPTYSVTTNVMVLEDADLRGRAIDPTRSDTTYAYLDPDQYPGGVFACDASGMSTCLAAREVFENTSAPWFQFVDRSDGGQVGEDVYFFRKARMAGYKLMVHPDLLCDHLKEIDLTHLDSLFSDDPPAPPWHPPLPAEIPQTMVVACTQDRWLDVPTADTLMKWQSVYGDKVSLTCLQAPDVRDALAKIVRHDAYREGTWTHLLLVGPEVRLAEDVLPYLASVDAPLVGAMSRTLVDGQICWAHWIENPQTRRLIAPQNISLADIGEPFEVEAFDPVCCLMKREVLDQVPAALESSAKGPKPYGAFIEAFGRCVRKATDRAPIVAPLPVARVTEIGLLGLLQLKLRLKEKVRAERAFAGVP